MNREIRPHVTRRCSVGPCGETYRLTPDPETSDALASFSHRTPLLFQSWLVPENHHLAESQHKSSVLGEGMRVVACGGSLWYNTGSWLVWFAYGSLA